MVGTHNSPSSAQLLQVLGAEPVRLDLLDARAVRAAVLSSKPDAIVHQATALADIKFGRSLDKTFATTNRLRTEGTDALLAAAAEAGVRRFVAQSFAPYLYARQGGPVKTEADPVDETPPPNTGQTYAAITYLEKVTTGFGGIALRYGGFYGAANDALIEPVRKRQFPVVGDGGGIFSWLHLDDGAAATVAALSVPRRSTTSSTTTRPGTRLAPGARQRAGRQATAARAGVAGPPARRPGRRSAGHPGPRRLQRQGQARTRLDAPVPQLARRFPGHLLGDRRGQPAAAARNPSQAGHATERPPWLRWQHARLLPYARLVHA